MAVFALLIVAAVQAHAAEKCALTINALNESGIKTEPALVSPQDVESEKSAVGSVAPDSETLFLKLKPEAAQRFATFTKSHVGRQLVIGCHGVEVARPFVRAEIRGTVSVTLPRRR